MISGNLKRIAADSNVILSGVIGKAALRVFIRPEIELITTHFNFEEVEEYLPHLAAKYRLDEKALFWQLKMLPLRIFPEKHYKNYLDRAEKLLKERDRDDVHLLALALKEEVPLWSNDNDFQKLSISLYTTAQLLKFLEE